MNAIQWYRNRDSRVAARYVAAVTKILRTIADNPDFYGWRDEDFREARVRGFPYCVIYQEVRAGHVFVVAIAHTSRDPDYWRHRTPGGETR